MRALEMGIYDDLDKQEQPILNIDIMFNNVVVFGGHISGKTNFLKTMIVRMHQNLEPNDEEEIYIIDFGGNLGEYRELPLVAACFDNSNEENIRRLFKTLEQKLDENKRCIGYDQFGEAYKNAEGKKPLHITLIIDNVNSFFEDERYANYRETLLKLSRDGLSKGLSVVMTANDTSGGMVRFMSSFACKFVLDASQDLCMDVFGMKVNKPMKTPGRGVTIIDGKDREFQTFMGFENEKAEFPDFVRSMSGISFKPEKIKAFDVDLTRDNFPEYCCSGKTVAEVEAQQNRAVVGLDYYYQNPVCLDFDDHRFIAIYGKKRFGKTNLLRIMINTFREKHPDYTVVLVDDGGKNLEEFDRPGDPKTIYINKFDDFIKLLNEQGYCKVNTNTGGPPAGQSTAFVEKPTPPTLFVVQSKVLYQNANRNTGTALVQLNAKAVEKGVYIILPDVRKVVEKDYASSLNSAISAAFLLDNIAEFVTDKGQSSVFGEMDPKELKEEYARCDIGDGYYFDIESDELKKVKFIKV